MTLVLKTTCRWYRLFTVSAALAAMFVEPAYCWNDAGHMIVNLIAYDLLDNAQRDELVALIREHPRFDQHFLGKMPQNIWAADEARKREWIFAYAACWPDLVRAPSDVVTEQDVQKFNRPNWHFVDFPVFLSPAEDEKFTGKIYTNLVSEPTAERDQPSMNIIQAIKNSSRIVAERSASPADRAIHVCWLSHLVGDSHQPLHSSSLHTSKRFVDGDGGGNMILVGGDKTLHGYWDGRVLDTRDFNLIRRTAQELSGDEMLKATAQSATEIQDAKDWIAEGHRIAQLNVYTDEVRQKVSDAENLPTLQPFILTEDYVRVARQIARQRVFVAGHRLANLLRQLLSHQNSQSAR